MTEHHFCLLFVSLLKWGEICRHSVGAFSVFVLACDRSYVSCMSVKVDFYVSVSGSFITRNCLCQSAFITHQSLPLFHALWAWILFLRHRVCPRLQPSGFIQTDSWTNRPLGAKPWTVYSLTKQDAHLHWWQFYFYRWTRQWLCELQSYYYMFMLVKCLDRGRVWTQAKLESSLYSVIFMYFPSFFPCESSFSSTD